MKELSPLIAKIWMIFLLSVLALKPQLASAAGNLSDYVDVNSFQNHLLTLTIEDNESLVKDCDNLYFSPEIKAAFFASGSTDPQIDQLSMDWGPYINMALVVADYINIYVIPYL